MYEHPGHAYIGQVGLPRDASDLLRYIEGYAAFLLAEADAEKVPVDLDRICTRFGVRWRIGPLPEQMEGWSDGPLGHILINADRPETRQRFTHGHELIELLFSALVESPVPEQVWYCLQGSSKEVLCNRGAAALLLPDGPFQDVALEMGVSVASARTVADVFGASLLATLIGLVERGPGLHALVGWRRVLKPSEMARGAPAQLALEPEWEVAPIPRLRVQWVRHTRDCTIPFIPRHKSISDGSVVGRATAMNCETMGHEELDLGPLRGKCLVEALPVFNAVADVVSLIHLPGDNMALPGITQAPSLLGGGVPKA